MAFSKKIVAAAAGAAVLLGGGAAVVTANQNTTEQVTVAAPVPTYQFDQVDNTSTSPTPTVTSPSKSVSPTKTATKARTMAKKSTATKKATTAKTTTTKKATVKKTTSKPTSEPTRTSSGKLNLARAATWDRLAQCESGGRWNINTGNGYYGGLQFNRATWLSVGGGEFASYPHLATRAEQITVANRLHAKRGFAPWPACSRKLGLR